MVEFAFKKDSELSNYFEGAPLVLPSGLRFLNSEAAYHSQKFTELRFKQMFCSLSPQESKNLAHQLIAYWSKSFLDDRIAYNAMLEVVNCKFTQNPRCMRVLLNSPGLYIVEDTTGWHDNRWGRCSCPECRVKPYTNYLGRILTDLRARYRCVGGYC